MGFRRGFKQLTAASVNLSGARHVIASVRRAAAGGRRVQVLGYHRVCDDFERESARAIESCIISRETFEHHIAFLVERFELVSMSRVVEVLNGTATAERDLTAITFDDGYADVLENALPVLQAYDATATIYVSTDIITSAGHFPHDRLYTLLLLWQQDGSFIHRNATPFVRACLDPVTMGQGGPHAWLHELIEERSPADLTKLIEEMSEGARVPAGPPATTAALDWDGVRALSAAGWEIGAHTTGHCVLSHMDPAAIERDLQACKASIEEATGRTPIHFAYCNGYYNEAVIAALQRTGFVSGVTTEDRLNRLGDDPYRIGRRVLWEGATTGTFGRISPSLLACQLDDAWSALGFNASEPGLRVRTSANADATLVTRRLA